MKFIICFLCFAAVLPYVKPEVQYMQETGPPTNDLTCGVPGNKLIACIYAELFYALISVVCEQFEIVKNATAVAGCALASLTPVSGILNGLSEGASIALDVCPPRIQYLGGSIEDICPGIFTAINGAVTTVTGLLGSLTGTVNQLLGGLLGLGSKDPTKMRCGAKENNLAACAYLLPFSVQAKLYCTMNRLVVNASETLTCSSQLLPLGGLFSGFTSGLNYGGRVVHPICPGVESYWTREVNRLCPGFLSAVNTLSNGLLDGLGGLVGGIL